MGMIGRWIDERCKAEPEVMRRVLNRKFGPLSGFKSADGCGCLVGSWMLCKNDQGRRPSNQQAEMVGILVYALTLKRPLVGCVFALGVEGQGVKRPDVTVVRWVKQRIRKSLGIAPVNRPVQLETVTR